MLPSSGEILVDGLPIVKQEKMLKSNLGYLPQEFGLFEDLTTAQFLDYIAALKSIDGAAAQGQLLHYGYAPDPAGGMVSFASIALS